jgi:glucan 1,3-beta-glucosidase
MLNTVDGVDGEGKLQDYWSWEGLADAGVVSNTIDQSYC